MTESDKAEIEKRIRRCLDELDEFCDSVTILVTKHGDGGTWSRKMGTGNWYARIAMAREFILEDQAKVDAESRPDPPDEGGEWKED